MSEDAKATDGVVDDAEAEAEVLARRLDDAHERLSDLLLELDAARADAAAARAEAEDVEDLIAAGRELVAALAKVREVERASAAGGPHFTWDERRERVARLHETFERAHEAFGADASRGGVVYVAVADVAFFIESDPEIRRELGLLPRSPGKAPWVAAKVRARFKR